MLTKVKPIGDHLREWRQRRRLSQLDLALDAEISAKHLSFLETGRSQPSREMLLHLAEKLNVPLRERNVLLVSAGYAPVYPERALDDAALASARKAVEVILKGHEPYPAIAVDRHWNLIASNAASQAMLAGADEALLKPPVNVLRLALHPKGMGARTINYGEWRAHLLDRLRQQIDVTADPVLIKLMAELVDLPAPENAAPYRPKAHQAFEHIAVPLQIASPFGTLSFFSTLTIFGTPVDITLSEMALETFFPADEATAKVLRGGG